MNKPDLDSLLNDVVGGPAYESFRGGLKQRALGEFRRERMRRRVRRVGAGLVLILGAVFALFWNARRGPGVSQIAVETVEPAQKAAPGLISQPKQAPASPAISEPGTPPSPRLETITTDQLIAAFPPGSCFLAELNGETILVFPDPALRKEFLR